VTRITGCRREDLREVEAILQLAREAAAWSADSIEELFEEHPGYLLLAWQSEEIAGFISGRRILGEGEILNLAVKPQWRRQGLGTALVKALLESLAREGVLQVFLEVRESNRRAVCFYQNLGFRQTGKRERYYRDPDEAALLLAAQTRLATSTERTNP
jgi:ribosomal-protein-alanine N-acetyltransferase